MVPRLAPLLIPVAVMILAARPAEARGGYELSRLIYWTEPGDPPPRFEQSPTSRFFELIFPGPIPESGWDPVPAKRLEMRNGAFVVVEPELITRPRDPDAQWNSPVDEVSLDLNRDGRPEVLRARTVMIPDRTKPEVSASRVMVEIDEGDRARFGDLLEGPSGGQVRLHGVQTTDFTGEGYPDLVVELEAENRFGIAFYSQAPLRGPNAASRRIEGISEEAFHCDRYGVFDLARSPQEFLSHLPPGAEVANPACLDRSFPSRDGHGRCQVRFKSLYLGWIRELWVDYLPGKNLVALDLLFPEGPAGMTPEQALDILTPTLGAGFVKNGNDGGPKPEKTTWRWKCRGAEASLSAAPTTAGERAVSLRMERR